MSLDLDLGHPPLLGNRGSPLAVPEHQHGAAGQQHNFSFPEPQDSTDCSGSTVPSLSPDGEMLVMDESPNLLQEMFEVCAQLAEDCKLPMNVDDYPPFGGAKPPVPMETVVQKLLERSARFCDVLDNLLEAQAAWERLGYSQEHTSHQAANSGSSSATSTLHVPSTSNSTSVNTKPLPAPRPQCCLVLTTTLVSAYIMLLRNWGRTFRMIHDLLFASDTPPVGRCALPSLMPTLQLGGGVPGPEQAEHSGRRLA